MREEHWAAYLDCVGELLASPQVQAMKDIRHHPGVSCFEHSLFVSYVAFRLARRWGRDGPAAAPAPADTAERQKKHPGARRRDVFVSKPVAKGIFRDGKKLFAELSILQIVLVDHRDAELLGTLIDRRV